MTKTNPLSRAKTDEVSQSGRLRGAVPGMAPYAADAFPLFLFSTNMAWGSLATKTSVQRPIPFNYTIADLFTVLKTAPVSTGNKKFRVGTTTDDDLFFVTGNFKFVSGDSVTTDGGMVRRGSATNLVVTSGSVGTIPQFKLPPTAAVVSNGGSVYGVLVIVPKQ